MMKRGFVAMGILAALVLAGCGDDDGGTVTGSPAGSGSGSGSGSHASGSHASGSPSGSGSHAEAGCEIVGGTKQSADNELHATLDEWSIVLDADSVAAGNVAFDATNEGEHPHEIVVIKGATPDDLTITDEGLDEEALPDGAEVLGEIESFPGGETCEGTFALEAGEYTLVCNIVEDDEGAHAEQGMIAVLSVT